MDFDGAIKYLKERGFAAFVFDQRDRKIADHIDAVEYPVGWKHFASDWSVFAQDCRNRRERPYMPNPEHYTTLPTEKSCAQTDLLASYICDDGFYPEYADMAIMTSLPVEIEDVIGMFDVTRFEGISVLMPTAALPRII